MKIIVRGHADVRVTENEVLADNATSTFEDGALTISDADGSDDVECAVQADCAAADANGGVAGCQMRVNGVSIRVGRCGDVFLSGPIRSLSVNRRAVDIPEVPTSPPAVRFKIPELDGVEDVEIVGSATVSFDETAVPSSVNLGVTLRGSGRVEFNGNCFAGLVAWARGVSQIGGAVSVDRAALETHGTAKIEDVHAAKCCVAIACDTSAISASVGKNAAITKRAFGASSVTVKRRN